MQKGWKECTCMRTAIQAGQLLWVGEPTAIHDSAYCPWGCKAMYIGTIGICTYRKVVVEYWVLCVCCVLAMCALRTHGRHVLWIIGLLSFRSLWEQLTKKRLILSIYSNYEPFLQIAIMAPLSNRVYRQSKDVILKSWVDYFIFGGIELILTTNCLLILIQSPAFACDVNVNIGLTITCLRLFWDGHKMLWPKLVVFIGINIVALACYLEICTFPLDPNPIFNILLWKILMVLIMWFRTNLQLISIFAKNYCFIGSCEPLFTVRTMRMF